jgi:hypothetical protein
MHAWRGPQALPARSIHPLEDASMRSVFRPTALFVLLLLPIASAWADNYSDSIAVFKGAGESKEFFSRSYGYAVFPSIGKGGVGLGAAHGTARRATS